MTRAMAVVFKSHGDDYNLARQPMSADKALSTESATSTFMLKQARLNISDVLAKQELRMLLRLCVTIGGCAVICHGCTCMLLHHIAHYVSTDQVHTHYLHNLSCMQSVHAYLHACVHTCVQQCEPASHHAACWHACAPARSRPAHAHIHAFTPPPKHTFAYTHVCIHSCACIAFMPARRSGMR